MLAQPILTMEHLVAAIAATHSEATTVRLVETITAMVSLVVTVALLEPIADHSAMVLPTVVHLMEDLLLVPPHQAMGLSAHAALAVEVETAIAVTLVAETATAVTLVVTVNSTKAVNPIKKVKT